MLSIDALVSFVPMLIMVLMYCFRSIFHERAFPLPSGLAHRKTLPFNEIVVYVCIRLDARIGMLSTSKRDEGFGAARLGVGFRIRRGRPLLRDLAIGAVSDMAAFGARACAF